MVIIQSYSTITSQPFGKFSEITCVASLHSRVCFPEKDMTSSYLCFMSSDDWSTAAPEVRISTIHESNSVRSHASHSDDVITMPSRNPLIFTVVSSAHVADTFARQHQSCTDEEFHATRSQRSFYIPMRNF